MNKTSTLNTFLSHCQQRINAYLKQCLPASSQPPQQLHRAMQYAVLSGGKRLRPQLVYATGVCLNASLETLDAPAAAIELMHSYSLVHDDLPAMDNDDLRRGRPTCHKAFNEGAAILVGDALQSLAFESLTKTATLSSDAQLQMIKILAAASGSKGMAGGQALDLEAEGKPLDLMQLEKIHQLKTAALIQASVQLGIVAAKCTDASIISALNNFAQYIGLAFQIQDDILDVEGVVETLGKMPGADATQGKATYPGILGLTEAKNRRQKAYNAAMKALDRCSLDTSNLVMLCDRIVEREA